MFVTINNYMIQHNGSSESLLPFRFITSQNNIIELTSFKKDKKNSDYDYLPLLHRFFQFAYQTFPLYVYLETYSSDQAVEIFNRHSIRFSVLKENKNTKLFKIILQNVSDLNTIYPIWSESGMDSLFNAITEKKKCILIDKNNTSINSQYSAGPILCFSDDLQGLFILGQNEWENVDYIKKLLLKDIEIIEENTTKI